MRRRQPGRRTSKSTRVRTSPARSRTTSAAGSWSSSTRCRTTPRTSRSPPAAGSRRRASRSTTTPTERCPRRSPSTTCRRAPVTRCRRRCPPAGIAAGATCSDGSPVSEHHRGPGRDRHLHLHEPQARPDRGRQGRAAQRLAGLLLHRRRWAVPDELLARRRLRRDALQHADVRERRAGLRLLGLGDRPERMVPVLRDLQRRQPGLEHQRRARRDRHVHVRQQPAAAASSWSRTRSPNDAAGLLLHRRRRALAERASRSTTTPTATLSNTRTFNDVAPASGYSLSETRAERLGPDERDLRRRQPRVEHQRVRRRDGHLHVHEPQARAARGREGLRPEQPAGLLVHGRRRAARRPASSSTTTPTRRCRTPARSRTSSPGSGYSISETVPSGWDQQSAIVQRRQPDVEHRR